MAGVSWNLRCSSSSSESELPKEPGPTLEEPTPARAKRRICKGAEAEPETEAKPPRKASDVSRPEPETEVKQPRKARKVSDAEAALPRCFAGRFAPQNQVGAQTFTFIQKLFFDLKGNISMKQLHFWQTMQSILSTLPKDMPIKEKFQKAEEEFEKKFIKAST